MYKNLKYCLLLFLSTTFFLASCVKSKEEGAEEKKDIYDSIHKVTIHVMPDDILEEESDSIKKYYAAFDGYEIWYDRGNREDLIAQIEQAKIEGLNPEDYNLSEIYAQEVVRDSLKKEDLLHYDVLLTKTFEKLATHFYKGKLNPKEIYSNWDLFEKRVAISSVLHQAISEKGVAATLQGLLPKHQEYLNLKKALVEIDKFSDITFDSLRFSKKIVLNDTVPLVKKIKKRLQYWNDYKNKDSVFTAIYDTVAFRAMKKFQLRHGLLADGVIGASTIKALNYSQGTRKNQILANLERWRWFSSDFGTNYILINLPAFELNYVSNKDTLATRRVVVGRPKRMSPILSSKLSNFVLNPTWTVPPTIIKEDLAVEAAKNRSYFSRSRITIYNSKNQEVSPALWNASKSNNYRYVQKPGYTNSLGIVKFNFPNSHLVYLHDTNHRELFSVSQRALSSGCIRVENPLALAKQILHLQDGERWQTSEIDSIIKKEKTYTIKVKEPVFVHILYWTATYKNNKMCFKDDMYNLDKKLYEKLRS